MCDDQLNVIVIALVVFLCRYARNFTLGIRNSNHYWRYMLPCSILFTVGQCFGAHIYRWTSAAGDVFMAIGISIMVHRVQSDLAVAGSFADFLHRSNAVFRTSQVSGHHLPAHVPRHSKTHTQKKRPSQEGKVLRAQAQAQTQGDGFVSPGDIQLEQLENGAKGSADEEKELKEIETKEENGSVGPATLTEGSTALVKSNRNLVKPDDEVNLYDEKEPELHAL